MSSSSSTYQVFEPSSSKELSILKEGFSIWAALFTWLWAFVNRLWMPGFILLVAEAFIFAVTLFNPLFALIALPFRIYVGFAGQGWQIRRFENSGYRFLGSVQASDKADAARKARAGQYDGRVSRPFSLLPSFGKMLAITNLTWKAAFRFRLFWVLVLLLLGTVVALPLVIKDDGTARGFTQILLTYTLGTITALLGFATLWLSCGILARDIEEAQMQMIVTKPISRWQIWLGKWLGIVSLNAVLLAIAGTGVFVLMQWRAQKLPAAEQAILRSEIFIARGSLKEPEEDISALVDEEVRQTLKGAQVSTMDAGLIRTQIEERAKAQQQVVAPNYARRWVIDFGLKKNSLREEPLFIRTKFESPEARPFGDPPTYRGVWFVGPPESQQLYQIDMPSVAAQTFHEIPIPPNLLDADGKLTIEFRNYNKIALLFPLEEGMEVLYREGGFALNFIRGLAIILCWLSLLAAVGLCAASFLSFPVAAFFAIAVLMLGMSSGTLSSVIERGSMFDTGHEGEATAPRAIDSIAVPMVHAALKLVNLVQGFSPIESLSSGRSITWGQLGLAFVQIVLVLGGIFAVIGIITFNRRELATAQVNA